MVEETVIEDVTNAGSPPPNSSDGKDLSKFILPLLAVLFVGGGVLTGWLISRTTSTGKQAVSPSGQVQQSQVKKGSVFGTEKNDTYSDEAVGVVKEGGINGEGTHHLERIGGSSQTVYLFSAVVDLDQFVERKVQVWGQTFSAQKAGWLLEVGRLKVLD